MMYSFEFQCDYLKDYCDRKSFCSSILANFFFFFHDAKFHNWDLYNVTHFYS